MADVTSEYLENPVLPSVASRMKVDLTVNEKGQIWMIYDRALSETVKWADYDVRRGRIVLALLSGRIQDVGLTLSPEMKDLLHSTKQLFLILQRDGKIEDMGIVPLMKHDYSLN